MIYKNILDLIGNTPVLKLKTDEDSAEVFVKLEKYNIGGSVKDRAVLGLIEDAESQGILNKNSVLVEATSGNTGIGFAWIGALKGYKVKIVMPDTMSVERRALIKVYGAELILTDGALGTSGAVKEAQRIVDENENHFMLQQFNNIANPLKHYESTALEILADFDSLDAFVAGVGTAGTISGVGKKLKEKLNMVEVIAVEPAESAVLSGNEPGKHAIQGIGAGFIPGNYDRDVVDRVEQITTQESAEMVKKLAREEGLFLGISSGAAIAVALRVAKELGKGKKVLAISPDGGEKYLSLPVLQ